MTDANSTIIRLSSHKSRVQKTPGSTISQARDTVFFSRPEFDAILNIYGKMVASGHWKNYAMDSTPEKAIFAVYQNVHDRPLYRIIKDPKRAQKQGAFSIVTAQGRVVKRSHDIQQLLKYFNKSLIKLIR